MSKRSAKKSLESQLDSYSASVRAAANPKTPSDGPGRWPVYAAAAGSALALSTSSATADIFYSGIRNITVAAPQRPYAGHGAIDIGGKQFGLSVYRNSGNFNTGPFHIHKAYAGAFITPPGTAAGILEGEWYNANTGAGRLGKGVPVSAGAGYFRSGNQQLTLLRKRSHWTSASGNRVFSSGNRGGRFRLGRPYFAGIRLSTGGGNFDYGWIQLEVNGTNGIPDSVTAIDWAYNEVPGQSIETDQIVPEPGGRSLALLAAGCLGVLAWRKRRAQRAA
jgi:hypothetical protein